MSLTKVEMLRLKRMETLVSRFRWVVLFVSAMMIIVGRGYLNNLDIFLRLFAVALIGAIIVDINLRFNIIPLSVATRGSAIIDFIFVSFLATLSPIGSNMWLIFVLLIITTAMRFGLGESMLSGILSAAAMTAMFIIERGEIPDAGDARILFIRAVFLLLVAFFCGIMSREERKHYIAREEHENRRNKQRETIFRIGQALTSSLDLDEILQVIVESTNIILYSSGSSIYELDHRSGKLILVATNGLPRRFIRKISMRFGEPVAGEAASRKNPIAAFDLRMVDSPIQPIFDEFGIKSILAVPLILEDEVVGVLETYSRKPHRFSDEEIELLNLFSSQAAVAIENAKLHQVDQNVAKAAEKKARDLETLFRTAQTITSSLKIDTVLNRVVDEVERVLRARVVSLMLYDEESDQVKVKISRGLSHEHIEHATFKPGETVEGEAFARKKPIVIDDILTDKSFRLKEDARREKLRSMLAVPLQVKGRPIGVLNIYNEKPGAFSQNDLELLQTFAAQAAIAIDNARLHEVLIEEERRRQEDEMRMARQIQQSLLPTRAPSISGLNIGFVCVQARQVGGDFYDFIPLENGYAVIIGDVAGKFLPAAMLVSMNKYVLRSAALAGGSLTNPLRTLNKVLVEETDPEIFVTLIYGIYDPLSRIFHYSNAGHMPILHYQAVTGRATYRRRHQLVLGVDSEMEFRTEAWQLAEGDFLVMFSDGVTEARDAAGDIFGLGALKRCATTNPLGTAEEILADIKNAVLEFSGNNVSDDYTILVLKAVPDAADRIIVPNIESSVGRVREFVGRVASRMGFDPEEVGNIVLAADEAFANAVSHAQDFSSANEVLVACSENPDCLVVEVTDGGKRNFVPDLESWPMPDPLSEGGRGIYIIKNLMDEVEYGHREKGTAARFTKYLEPPAEPDQ